MDQREARSEMAPLQEMSAYSVNVHLGRELPEKYQALIFSRWLRSLRHGNVFFKLIDSDTYYNQYHIYIEAFLRRPYAIVRIAALKDDDDIVLGFSVSERNILHYIHVHSDYRRNGIAKALVPFEVDTITHLTKIGHSIWKSKLPHAIFNPFA